jgi:phage shock protein C
MEKRLHRARDERMIWGICGGIAKYFSVDPTLVRVIAVLLIVFGGWIIIAYIILRFLIPLEPLEA